MRKLLVLRTPVHRVTVVLALIAAGVTVQTDHASADVLPPGSTAFTAQFDPSMATGAWFLTTHDDQPLLHLRELASGLVPADGAVRAVVPTALVAQSTSGQFRLQAIRLDGGTSMDASFASRSLGLPVESLGTDTTHDLGTAAVRRVHTYATPTEAQQASTCGAACVSPDDVLAETAPTDDTYPASDHVVPSLPAGIAPSVPMNTTSGVNRPALSMRQPPRGGTPGPSQGSGDCSASMTGTSSCVSDARDVYGVFAFRGWSGKVAGADNTFKVRVGAQQVWQNALRTESGPFSTDGTTTRTVGTGSATTFPKRGDCGWGGSYADHQPCDADGHLRQHGRDTWRWEQVVHRYCSGYGSCNSWTEEDLFEKSFDGGTEPGYFQGTSNYYRTPSSIMAGNSGSWSRYLPGANQETKLESSYEHTGGASVNVNWSQAMSSATFTSTMTVQNTHEVVNTHDFRADLDFMRAYPGYSGDGHWYRYDMASGWKLEYFSCEWGGGWSSGSPCWPNGS